MKILKKSAFLIIALMLVLSMILTIVPKNAYAASSIKKIALTYYYPVAGDTISYYSLKKSNADGASTSYDVKYKIYTSETKFSEYDYSMDVTLTPKKGYTFDIYNSAFWVTLNDDFLISDFLNSKDCTVTTKTSDKIEFTYTFHPYPEKTTITHAHVQGVIAPEVGAHPVTTGIKLNTKKHATVGAAYWYCEEKNGEYDSYLLEPDDVFEEGKVYRLVVSLQFNPGVEYHMWTRPYVRFDDNKATDLVGFFTYNEEDGYLFANYDYPALKGEESKGISSVTLEGLTAPEAGKAPVNSYKVVTNPEGAISVMSSNTGWYVHDSQKGYIPFSGKTFEAGKAYAFVVHFNPSKGFKIDENTQFKALGNVSPLNADENSWYFGAYYSALPEKQEDPKQDNPKQEDPKQEDPKQDDPKQEDPKPETKKSNTLPYIIGGAAIIIIAVCAALLLTKKKK